MAAHAAVLVSAVLLSAVAQEPAASDSFAGVQYVEGHPALARKKTKGTLRVDATGLSFADASGRRIFEVPIADVVEAQARTVTNEFPADPDPREYLAVATSGAPGDAVILFRTPRWQARSIAVKINLYRSRLPASGP